MFNNLISDNNLDNIVFLHDFNSYDIEETDKTDIVIMGDITWTDYNKGDPLLMLETETKMNDKRVGRLSSQWCYREHRMAMNNPKYELDQFKDRQIIIVTHHPITCDYLQNSRFRSDKLNGGYCSDYNQLILDNPNIKHICSGHSHQQWSGKIGTTQYHINPLGYPGENKGDYKPYTFDL